MHLLYPTKCPVCGEIIGYSERFCKACEQKLTEYHDNFSIKAAESFSAAFEYDENSSPAVILMKRGICGNADYALGGAVADALKENGISEKADVIVPVPMYPKDERKRGFNQAFLIAKAISHELNIPVCENAVVKSRITANQKELSREERAVNLKNAFSVKSPDAVSGKQILLVDDVCTTGSTLTEITEILLRNGASAVHCAVCCKTPQIKSSEGDK